MRTDSTTSTAVAHKRIAQCFLQRTEPWFVVPPIRQAVAADGTANLLGARGANTANRFVKLQAVTSDAQNPPGTGAAAAALLLTLLDPDCTLWLAPRLACGPANAWLRFHTGCRIVADPAAARFAWSDADQLPSLSRFALGSEFEPELSCTCVVEVQALEQQHGWGLRGPGIQDRHHLAVTGLAAGFFAEWQANHALFPRGVDLLLCAGQQVAALARTTELEA